MSVGGPQIPQSQQGISHNEPVQRPGQDSGNIKAKTLSKKIGHQLAKLLPDRAKKLFLGHRFVQVLFPKSVEATPGLKDTSVKLSVKPLAERTAQAIDVLPKLGGDQASLLQRRDSLASFDSGFGDGDNLSITSNDSYTSVRSNNSDGGYDSVKFDESEFIDNDNGYMTADEVKKNSPLPETDLDDEVQYDHPDNLKSDDPLDNPEISEEITETVETNTRNEGGVDETNPEGSNTGGGSGQDSPDEGQGQPDSVPDEPTISGEDVLARKFTAYEQLLDNDDFGALEQKLSNTNNYQTAKKVAQLALEKQGKESFVFMIAQNRMQELKADQLFNELGGYQAGADYNQIREAAAEMMDQSRYSQSYQTRVLALVDQRLQEFETKFEGMTSFSHLDQYDEPPPVPPKSEQLVEELTTSKANETKVDDEAPPLPPRPETQTKSKKQGRRMPGFLRRDR